ncbi:MAG: alpha/beta hydrolase [Candidatus Thorarchaeota archaeon]
MYSKEIEFNVDSDRLVGVLSTHNSEPEKVSLILHPHPLYGGSMDDSVVQFIDHVLLNQGYATFKFNFRGTNSRADYKGVSGAVQDALAASRTLLHESRLEKMGVLGYSFGGSVALHIASRINAEFLVTFSASLDIAQEMEANLDSWRGINCPTLMFHGDSDSVVPPDDMRVLSELLISSVVRTVLLEGEGHFYMRHLPTAGFHLSDFLQQMAKG